MTRLYGVAVVCAMALAARVPDAGADIVAHNGNAMGSGSNVARGDQSALFGPGETPENVDVDINENGGVFGSFDVDKGFNELALVRLQYEYLSLLGGVITEPGADGLAVQEDVFNDSGEDWGFFTIQLFDADFFISSEGGIGEVDEGTVDIQDVLGFTATGYTGDVIATLSRDAEGPTLEMEFTEPFSDGASFSMEYLVSGPQPGFIMFENPSPFNVIPAPGAALLATVGLGFAGCLRRRRA